MKKIERGDQAIFDFEGKLADGTLVDSSEQSGSMAVTIEDQVELSTFEQSILGMAEGDTKTVHVPVERAFGERKQELITTISRTNFPQNIDVKPGQILEIPHPEGKKVKVRVAGVTSETVVLDANHPLAGKELFFELKLKAVHKRGLA